MLNAANSIPATKVALAASSVVSLKNSAKRFEPTDHEKDFQLAGPDKSSTITLKDLKEKVQKITERSELEQTLLTHFPFVVVPADNRTIAAIMLDRSENILAEIQQGSHIRNLDGSYSIGDGLIAIITVELFKTDTSTSTQIDPLTGKPLKVTDNPYANHPKEVLQAVALFMLYDESAVKVDDFKKDDWLDMLEAGKLPRAIKRYVKQINLATVPQKMLNAAEHFIKTGIGQLNRQLETLLQQQ